jgi:hypothetical protein
MSLTLARLCGEWQLVSENYKTRSGKYEAQIVIFRILAAIDRFSQFLRKCKAGEENWKAVEEIGKPLKKAESR